MSKPIDWVKPLRVVNRHWRAWVEEIDPGASLPVKIRICDDKGNSWIVRVDGRGYSGELVVIENIPPEPRIVERWMHVEKVGDGHYRSGPGYLPSERYEPNGGFRIARVLIEEPE